MSGDDFAGGLVNGGGVVHGANAGQIRVKPELARMIEFRSFNLMNTSWASLGDPFDLVFCRNVLIYFEDPIKKMVQHMLARAIAPGGVLVLGASVQMLAPEYFDSRPGRGGPWYVRNENRI